MAMVSMNVYTELGTRQRLRWNELPWRFFLSKAQCNVTKKLLLREYEMSHSSNVSAHSNAEKVPWPAIPGESRSTAILKRLLFRTLFSYVRNGWTDCADAWCVVRGPLAMRVYKELRVFARAHM